MGINKESRKKDISVFMDLVTKEMNYLEQFNLLKTYDRLQAFAALITLQEYLVEEGMRYAES